MRVLLIKDVGGLGRLGEIKEVSDGHARNFLIPRKLAVPATENVVNKVLKENQEKQDKKAREDEKLKELVKKLNKASISIRAKASKDSLFAQIHEKQISELIREKYHIEFEPKLIVIDNPIKTLGRHQIKIKVSQQYQAVINLDVQPL
ncbi:MAG TPA: 50S ribosomal protein L9 [Verrucomicrobiae bacterium]|nr:50S ribosomal protein L9 [Verrucomicrobiae bacterium]